MCGHDPGKNGKIFIKCTVCIEREYVYTFDKKGWVLKIQGGHVNSRGPVHHNPQNLVSFRVYTFFWCSLYMYEAVWEHFQYAGEPDLTSF